MTDDRDWQSLLPRIIAQAESRHPPAEVEPDRLRLSGAEAATLHASADPLATRDDLANDIRHGVDVHVLQLASPGQFGLPMRYDAIVTALSGIALAHRPILIAAGDQYAGALASLLAVWEAQNLPTEARFGGVLADPLGTLATTGQLEQDLFPTLEVMGTLLANGMDLIGLPTVALADGLAWHDLGADAESELALMLASFLTYSRLLIYDGVAKPAALQAVAVRLAASADRTATLTKLAAARLVLAEATQTLAPGLTLPVWASTSIRGSAALNGPAALYASLQAAEAGYAAGADRITILPHTWIHGRDSMARQLVLAMHQQLRQHPGPRAAAPDGAADLSRRALKRYQRLEEAGGLATLLRNGELFQHVSRAPDPAPRVNPDWVNALPIKEAGLEPHPPSAV